jgi:hypothetical protein
MLTDDVPRIPATPLGAIRMKIVSGQAPVRLSWLEEQGFRLDASTYVSGTYEIRDLLRRLSAPAVPLSSLTAGHEGGIYNGPQFRRVYVTSAGHGVPFVGSADMLEADLTSLPLLRRIDAESPKLSYLRLEPGMSLVSCSGTVGKVTYVRPDMAGYWSSQDSIKIVADPDKICHGYLQAFLRSQYGVPFLTTAKYGTGIRHLEPANIAGLLVPRFGDDIEHRIHILIEDAAALRARFQSSVVTATADLFTSAGLPQLADLSWHDQERDIGFIVPRPLPLSIRALNFAPRAQRLLEILRSVPHRPLGEICADGKLGSGVRFKRIEADQVNGVRLIGQRQGFWLRPDGRWISPRHAPAGVFADDETVMVAAQGTLGENEVFCRSIFVTGGWLDFAYTQHFLRIVSGLEEFPGAYLYAFFRSACAFRILRSMSVGGKQQDIHEVLRTRIPVPENSPADRARVAEIVRSAYRARDEADEKEDLALALLDEAVREAAG